MTVLAAVPPGTAGPLGGLVVLLLALATVLLLRSLNTQLKRVPSSFDPPAGSDAPADGSRPPDLPDEPPLT